MSKEHFPVYQIQDYKADTQKERYFYFSSFAVHLKEHLFIREPHKHNFYVILFITQGTGTHTIDFKTYEVKPNIVFFMIPGQVHSWELSDDADGLIILFMPEFYLKEFPHRKFSEFPFFNALLHKPTLYISTEENASLMLTFQALQQEYGDQRLMRNEMLRRYLDILLIYLNRIYQSQASGLEVLGEELSLLQKLEDLIEQHYKEHVPVTYYADELNVTPKHLKDVCKRSLGKTTHELIQERSLLEAQRLLVHSELTSSQIAAELGYFDISYFFRFFKKHTRCTPENFRNLIIKTGFSPEHDSSFWWCLNPRLGKYEFQNEKEIYFKLFSYSNTPGFRRNQLLFK